MVNKMTIYTKTTIDLYNKKPPTLITAKQGDTGRGFIIEVLAGNEKVDISGETINVYIKKPDGTLVYAACDVEDGNVKGLFDNQMLAVAGDALVELELVNGTERVTSPVFVLRVVETIIDGEAIESSNEFTALEEALSAITTIGNVTPVTIDTTRFEERTQLGYVRIGSLVNLTMRLRTTAALTAGTDYTIIAGIPAPAILVEFSVDQLNSNNELENQGVAWIGRGATTVHFIPATNMASGTNVSFTITYMTV